MKQFLNFHVATVKQRLSKIRRIRRVQILRALTICRAEFELAARRVEAGIVAVVAQFRDGPGWRVDVSGAQVARIHDHLALVQRMVGTARWDHVSWVVKRGHIWMSGILRMKLKSALISHRQGAFRQRGKLRFVGRVTVSHLDAVGDGTESVLKVGAAVQRSRTPEELRAVGFFAVAQAEICQDAFATALSLNITQAVINKAGDSVEDCNCRQENGDCIVSCIALRVVKQNESPFAREQHREQSDPKQSRSNLLNVELVVGIVAQTRSAEQDQQHRQGSKDDGWASS